MTPVLAFEEMRLVLELYSAILVFLIPFAPKKAHFLPRVLIFLSIATALTLLYFPVFQSKDAPRYYLMTGLWYPVIFFSVIFFARFCFKINWCNAIFMSISSFCTQNIVYVILHEWIARLLFPELREHILLYIFAAVLCCAIVYTIIYYAFARQLARCRGTLFDDTPANLLLYTIMFFLIIV